MVQGVQLRGESVAVGTLKIPCVNATRQLAVDIAPAREGNRFNIVMSLATGNVIDRYTHGA